MNIFILNYILMIAEAVLLIYKPRSNPQMTESMRRKRKKRFVILVCLQWILISGLRHDYVGNDTANYMRIFENHVMWSWERVFKNFSEYYLHGGDEFEPGYILLEKLLGTFSQSHEVYKFAVAVIFMTSMGVFIYRNSDDPFMSFVLYGGMFYTMFSLTGFRQVLSVAVGVFWSFEFVKKRKFVPFLLLVLIGATLHKSTLIFILFYFIANKKITKPYVVSVIVCVIVMAIYRDNIFDYVKVVFGYDQYSVMENVSQKNFLFMFTVLVLMSMWRYRYVVQKNKDADIYYNALIMSAVMIPFAMANPTAMRLVYDFALILMLLLPSVLESFSNDKDRMIIYSAIVVVFGYFILTKAPDYIFYWEETPSLMRWLNR